MTQKLIKTTDNGLMKFNTETAITSKAVADGLGVEHRYLMKAVKRAEKYHKTHRNEVYSSTSQFNPVFNDYTYESRGKSYKCKLMNEDGVKALIKVVDTQEAYNYFAILMGDFNMMKVERSERAASKSLQRSVTDSLQVLYHRLHNETDSTQKEALLYMTFNKKCFKAITGTTYHKDLLDTLNAQQACDLAELRDNTHKQLDLMLEHETAPKQIRANLWAYIEGFVA